MGGCALLEVLAISLLAGAATGLGSLPVLLVKNMPRIIHNLLLGLAAGVMLAAASFSLLVPALEEGSLVEVSLGLTLAAMVMQLLEYVIPHQHPHLGSVASQKAALLMALAVTLHNFPEGMAVGVGYASGLDRLGLVLALAIAAQNIPEGLAIAVPLAQAKSSPLKILGYSTASGLVEPVGAMGGLFLVNLARGILPFALAFAAGAMLYVVSHELIPQSHRGDHGAEATIGVMLGFILMIAINELVQ